MSFYWLAVRGEVVGTVALGFTAGLAFLTGYYLLFTARRIDRAARGHGDAEIADGAGELRLRQPAQLVAAGRWRSSRRRRSCGIIFGWWLFIIGAVGGALAVIGFVFEYYRGEPAH